MINLVVDNNPQRQLIKLTNEQNVNISGRLITLRDSSCIRLAKLQDQGEPLPVNFAGSFIFFCGPTPKPPGRVIGSIGPTTSQRMEQFLPLLLDAGALAFLGKGSVSKSSQMLIKSRGARLLAVTGGIGALLSQTVENAQILAFPELGAEAIWELEVKELPAVVLS
jgi:fumarate hydratase subunit beta